jgi:NADH:ubiquinone reductase (H+-translocating)
VSLDIPTSPFPRIILIGGGFGGLNAAKKLKGSNNQLVVIDRNNHHTFQPLLYQVATSGLEPDSIAYPLRKFLGGSKNVHFRMTEVEEIIPKENKIVTASGIINYDYLVIATGTKTNFFGMDDMAEHAAELKSVSQAIDMRHLFLQNFEKMLLTDDELVRQRLMNFVIAGGGPTGVELAGALCELRKRVLPRDYPELDMRQMRIILLDPSQRLLGTMSEFASAHALKYLKKLGVEVRLGIGVKSYNGVEAVFSNGEVLPTETLVWAAGVKGDSIPGFDASVIAKGNRIKVDEYNRVKGFENIFAIGDIAMQEDPRYSNGLPGLAPVAIQQGQHAAKNILRLINKQALVPFKYWDKGSLATIGRLKAVGDISKSIHLSGWVAWWAWLLVHLFYLIGFSNKLMVFSGWIWNYFTFDRRLRLIVRPYKKV